MPDILSSEEYLNLYYLPLISTVRYFGIMEEAVDRRNPFQIYFVFKESRRLNDIIDGYHSGRLAVEPYTFSLCLKETQRIIYDN